VKEGGNLAVLAAYEVREDLACQILVQPALDAGVADSREWLGAPPARIITSEHDPGRTEAERYAIRLEASGVRVEWTCLDGAPDDAASEAMWLCAEHLRETFGLPVPIPIVDVLDLHTVHPKDVRRVVEEYLREARRRGFRQVRIIHGRGIGVQREIVRGILARDPSVRSFSDAPPEAGGWGATLAEFR
jgi:acetyl esterase/lipase